MREGSDPRSLIEVRRYLARSFDVQFTPPDQFDRILSDRYAADQQDAAGTLGLGETN
jgi:general secretion pathway protein E